ncbi:Myb-like domain-containing protein [Entamoeba marina]
MSVKTGSTPLHISSLVQNIPNSTDNVSIFSDQHIVTWSEKEQGLLDQHVDALQINENNLKSILEIAMLFPTKTVQQLTMRIRWLSHKDNISWEQYSKQQKSISPAQSPKHELNYTPPPRKKSELKSVKRQSKARKRRSVPNTKIDAILSTSPDYSNTVFVRQPHQPKQQQLQTESIKSDPTNHSNIFTQPAQMHVKPNQNLQPNNYLNQQVRTQDFAQQTTYLNQPDLFSCINNTILLLSTCLGANLNSLLELTDDIARPSRLPFLSLMLSLPPTMQQLPNFNGSVDGGYL